MATRSVAKDRDVRARVYSANSHCKSFDFNVVCDLHLKIERISTAIYQEIYFPRNVNISASIRTFIKRSMPILVTEFTLLYNLITAITIWIIVSGNLRRTSKSILL